MEAKRRESLRPLIGLSVNLRLQLSVENQKGLEPLGLKRLELSAKAEGKQQNGMKE